MTTAVASDTGAADLRSSIATVTVDPAAVSGTVGDSGAFTAVVKDRWGRVITGASVTWSTSDSSVVRIRANGFAVAAGPGAATVSAVAGGKVGTSQVTIAGIPVASISVSPSSASGVIGDSASFSATALDANGNALTGRTIVWSSSDPGVVTVDAAGMAHAVGAGSAQLIATSEGTTGAASVSVSDTITSPAAPVVASVTVSPGAASGAVNDSAQFTATAQDANGAAIDGRTVTWSSSNTAVVVVSATGMGRAVGEGSAQLVATVDGVQGTANISVSGSTPPPPPARAPAPVASVTSAPSNLSVSTGTSAQLTATLRDASGNELSGRSVSWSSSNGLVASVSGSGLVTGLVAGSATITATSEGVSASAPASVTLLPPPPSGGNWPDMPSTYSVLTDQPFDPLSAFGWQLIWNTNGYGTITNNSTAPFSASSVFQVMYPAGFAAGSAPATQYFPLGGRRNVYIGTWWKANADWQGHESNVNKIQFLFPASGGGDMYMVAYGPPGGPYEIRTALQFIGADTRDWLRPNVSSGNVTMGEWHRLEWLVEYNTSGANGIVRWWVDGQLVGDYRDVTFPAGGFDEYKLSPTWGGMGGINKLKNDYFWFDHVTIGSR